MWAFLFALFLIGKIAHLDSAETNPSDLSVDECSIEHLLFSDHNEELWKSFRQDGLTLVSPDDLNGHTLTTEPDLVEADQSSMLLEADTAQEEQEPGETDKSSQIHDFVGVLLNEDQKSHVLQKRMSLVLRKKNIIQCGNQRFIRFGTLQQKGQEYQDGEKTSGIRDFIGVRLNDGQKSRALQKKMSLVLSKKQITQCCNKHFIRFSPLQRGKQIHQGVENTHEICNSEDTAQSNHQHNTSFLTRIETLLDHFNNGAIRFDDIKDKHYTKSSFEEDILQLMCAGYDIRKTESEHYYCLGQADNTFMPYEHVAVAMFNILKKGQLSSFDLCFQLYRKGYRGYTKEFILSLEKALIVDDVHPYVRNVNSGTGVDACVFAKNIWRKVQGLPYSQFQLYMKNIDPEHARTLEKNNFMEAIMHLRSLHRGGGLYELRDMKRFMGKCEKSVGFNQGSAEYCTESASLCQERCLLQEEVYIEGAPEYHAYAHQHLLKIKKGMPCYENCDSPTHLLMPYIELEPHAETQDSVCDAAYMGNCFSQEVFFEGWREIELGALLGQYEVGPDFAQKGIDGEKLCCYQSSFEETKEVALDSLALEDTQQSKSARDDVAPEDMAIAEEIEIGYVTFNQDGTGEPIVVEVMSDVISQNSDVVQGGISNTESDFHQGSFEGEGGVQLLSAEEESDMEDNVPQSDEESTNGDVAQEGISSHTKSNSPRNSFEGEVGVKLPRAEEESDMEDNVPQSDEESTNGDVGQEDISDPKRLFCRGFFDEEIEVELVTAEQDAMDGTLVIDMTSDVMSQNGGVVQRGISNTESDFRQDSFEGEVGVKLLRAEEESDMEDNVPQSDEESTNGDIEQEDISDTESNASQDSLYCDAVIAVCGHTLRPRKRMREEDPSALRVERIMELLSAKSLCFSDVKNTDYLGKGKKYFEEDILQAMHNGADVRKTAGDRYHCIGKLKEIPEPSEDVAIAMFNMLSKGKMPLFSLKFQLYMQGYRKYTPKHLEHLELALAVGGVHPCRVKINARGGVDSCQALKEIWQKVGQLSEEQFSKYLNKPSKVHSKILSIKRNKSILWRLWFLSKDKTLEKIEKLYADFLKNTEDDAQHCQSAMIALRDNRKEQIMHALIAKTNQEVYFRELLQMTHLSPKKEGRVMLMGVITSLVLHHAPILYYKDRGSVKLVNYEIPIDTPKENTNLVTMVYDLTQKWKNINKDELAYYAYRGGYWHDFGWGKRKLFDESVIRYIDFLAILENIDICCCPKSHQVAVKRQRNLWKIVQEEGEIKDLEHYKKNHQIPGIVQKDLYDISQMEVFLASSEFKVFHSYLKAKNCTQAVAKIEQNGCWRAHKNTEGLAILTAAENVPNNGQQSGVSEIEGNAPGSSFEEKNESEGVTTTHNTEEESFSDRAQQNDAVSSNGAVAQEEISDTEDRSTLREVLAKDMSLTSQTERLIMRLKIENLCFSDVKDSEYSGRRKSSFQEDILQAMHKGADIRKTEDGRYHCFGQLKALPNPSENVAIAMRNLLREGAITLFDLCFQLYVQGYRAYTPTYFDHAEVALAVGGVHPCCFQTKARRSVNSCESLKKVWRNIMRFSFENFSKYLQYPEKVHAEVLQTNRNRQILLCLWNIRKDNVLPQLEKPPVYFFVQNHPRKQQVISILHANITQEMRLEDLFEMTLLSKKNGVTNLFQVILSLCEAFPIIYDKERRTVKLLDKDIPKKFPQKNTNLLTMVYDLTKKWKDITYDELAYYAYRGGYWPEGFLLCGRSRLDACVHNYKKYLTIMDADCFSQKSSVDINRQRDIWKIVKEEGIVQNTAYYKKSIPDTTEEDISNISQVLQFSRSQEFMVFLTHLRELIKAEEEILERAKIVEQHLRQGPIQAVCLWDFCSKKFDFKEKKDMWNIVGILTEKEEGGRVLYDLKTTMFSWNDESCMPKPSKNMLVAEIFTLIQNPDVPEVVLCYMLKQQGFQDVSVESLREVIEGLEVFGLSPARGASHPQVCDVINIILTSDLNAEENMLEDGYSTDAWKVAERVVEWFHNGAFGKLLQAYEEGKEGAPPTKKRKKLGVSDLNPRDIIRLETPKLYDLLQRESQ